MFTIDQIKAAHSKVKSGADFPAYIQELKQLGVEGYDTYVNDGHSLYAGSENYHTKSPAKYQELEVEEKSNPEKFKAYLKDHQQGKTDYPTFCKQSAETGIEKWTVDLKVMTCIYFDKEGSKVLVEEIPGV